MKDQIPLFRSWPHNSGFTRPGASGAADGNAERQGREPAGERDADLDNASNLDGSRISRESGRITTLRPWSDPKSWPGGPP